MPSVKCAVCNCWCSPKDCKSLSSPTYSWFHDYLKSKRKIFNLNELLYCKRCTGNLYAIKNDSITVSGSFSSEPSSSDLMEVEKGDDRLTLDNILFTGSGHHRCVICRIGVVSGMITMSKSARLDLLLIHRLYAPYGTRCCTSHLINDHRLRPNEYVNMEDRLQFPTQLSPQDVRDLFNDIFSFFDELRSSPRLDFDDPSLTNEDYETWTGWSKEQFDDMFKKLSLFLRSSLNQTSRNALAIEPIGSKNFWTRTRPGPD